MPRSADVASVESGGRFDHRHRNASDAGPKSVVAVQFVQCQLGYGEEQGSPRSHPEGDLGLQSGKGQGAKIQNFRPVATISTRQMKESVEISDDEFSALWDTYAMMLHGLCWRYADRYRVDIDVMEQAARMALFDVIKWAKKNSVTDFAGYLHNTCRNMLIEVACKERGLRRNRKFEPKLTNLDAWTKDGDIVPLELTYRDPQPSWDIVPIVRKAVDRLSPKSKEAVISHYWDGESFRDIATRNGEKYDAAWMTHRRAIQKLRKNLRCQI
jgi:RNA polymerase sigma factor (sigma-70 family)